jgi:ABC-type multidrug transport system fused ATPase/permease subunit
MQADRILVLGPDGKTDIGAHAELIARPGLYREIYEIQMRADDRALLENSGKGGDA